MHFSLEPLEKYLRELMYTLTKHVNEAPQTGVFKND